jgi:SET domain-containing protein
MKTKPKVSKQERLKKIKEAIIVLNDVVKVKLAPSSIHGIGVFALFDIKKGEKLYLDAIPHAFDVPYREFKKLKKEIREQILSHWVNVINGSYFLYPVTKMTAFLNHSDTPNVDAMKDEALIDIPKGTELTEDYRLIKNYHKVYTWLVDKK